MKRLIEKIQSKKILSEAEMSDAIAQMIEGRVLESDMELFLTTLATRTPDTAEIIGAARVLRARAKTIEAPDGTIDCCGTGGDGLSTYNISTAVALVAAACGVPIAKHGGGASTSKSGSMDVLAELGVNFDMTPEKLEEALRRFNFAFLAAPKHHAAMKNVREVRRKIGRRTIFNLLGPLANPANAKRQLVGVYDKNLLLPFAEVLKALGVEKACVVHGADGLDEISITGPTYIATLDRGVIAESTITPTDFGLQAHDMAELKGGDVKTNAQALRNLLQGQKSAYSDIVLANVSAVLNLHGSAKDLKEGANKAAQAIDSGAALKTLNDYITFTKEPA